MVENMKPHDCIEIYNRLTARLGEAIPVTDASLERAAWFLDWCDKKWINPKHWIVARHEANGWAYQVDFQDLAHPSEEFMERWQTWGADRMASMDQERADRECVVEDTDRVAGITVIGEAAKRAYANDRQTCMVVGRSLTGGWHPDSEWCQFCELDKSCRERLPARVREARS